MSIENDPAAPVGDSTETRAGLSRRTIMKGAAWTVPALMVATSAPAYAVSCAPGKWNVVGRGKLISGGLFTINLDQLAAVDGSIATAPGFAQEYPGYKHNVPGWDITLGPPVHPPVGPSGVDEHTDPLSVTALGGITINITGVDVLLANILQFPISPDLGTLNQYSYASAPDSESRGASGAVDDHGIVRTDPGASYPTFATIDLKALVAGIVGSWTAGVLANIANLKLDIGAVAGRAQLIQACNSVTDPSGRRLNRDYLLAHLRLLLNSPLLATVITTLKDTLNGVLNNPLVSTALGLLTTAIGLLRGWTQTETRVDLSTLTGNIPSGATQPIQLNLGDGTAIIDLGALLGGSAFGASDPNAWLNNLPPNTILLADPGYQLPNNAIDNFAQGIIDSTVDIFRNTIQVRGRTGFGPWSNWEPITNIAGGGVGGLLDSLINIVKGIVATALGPVLLPVKALLNVVLDDILEQTLRITVNEQNKPGDNNNPATTPAIHDASQRWLSGNNGPLDTSGLRAGRYDVAAIALHALDTVKGLDLYLARGSVGPHTPAP